jgi:hypothetical protein
VFLLTQLLFALIFGILNNSKVPDGIGQLFFLFINTLWSFNYKPIMRMQQMCLSHWLHACRLQLLFKMFCILNIFYNSFFGIWINIICLHCLPPLTQEISANLKLVLSTNLILINCPHYHSYEWWPLALRSQMVWL